MKMWDEVGDPDSKEAKMRRNTELWLRDRLPPPEWGWTPGGLHAELMALTAEKQRAKEPAETWFAASRKFVSELLLVFEGEGLVRVRRRRDAGRYAVTLAFPVDVDPDTLQGREGQSAGSD